VPWWEIVAAGQVPDDVPAVSPTFVSSPTSWPDAFRMLAGLAPFEVWSSYPVRLDGEAALELPGGAAHSGYPLALAVCAVLASVRSAWRDAEELCRRAAEANARQASPDWRVEEVISGARYNIAIGTGAFIDTARLSEEAAGFARTGGDIADASLQLTMASGGHLLVGDAAGAVPLAQEALALARRVGAPALIASALLAVGASVAATDPEQARACLNESRELSTGLGYQSTLDHVWATGVAFLVNDRAATLQLGHRAIPSLQWGGDPWAAECGGEGVDLGSDEGHQSGRSSSPVTSSLTPVQGG
jgi:hypothetical protein